MNFTKEWCMEKANQEQYIGTTGIYVGRFQPIHKGHQLIIDTMIKNHDIDNIILIIGSTNRYDEKNPYSFELRKEFIQELYPNINIFPIEDVSDDRIWLKNLFQIINDNSKYKEVVFYGGSLEDVYFYDELGLNINIIDRTKVFPFSSTNIRKHMKLHGRKNLEYYIDKKIIDKVISNFNG